MQSKLPRLFRPDMLGDAVDVVHQAHRIPEGIGVHVLHQEGLFLSVGQQEIHFVGMVHIAHLDGLVAQVLIGDPESSGNLQQLVKKLHMLLLFLYWACSGKSFSRATRAASCSARFLLLPLPVPTTVPFRQTSTTKCLS